MEVDDTNHSDPSEQSILRYYLYQVVDHQQKNMIHDVYTSMDNKWTYVLYYPSSKTHTLHHLKQTISEVFSPDAAQYYIQ